MALESSDLVLHDKAIVMPAATVDQLLAEVSVLTRVHLQGMLPVKLARGVPPFVNDELIRLAEKRFLHGNEVGAYATYAGDRHEEVPEPNAFRGDAEYIDHVVATLKQEWGLEISPTQLITGTAGGQDMITEILDHHILDRNRSVATSNRTFDRTNRHIDRRLRNGQGERRVIQRSSDGINVDDMVRFYREANQSGKNGVFFVVADGSNPDGYTAKIAELAEICDLAHGYNGEVLIDAAYAGLYFDEADKTDYSKLQKYIDEGVLTIVFTSTKEGGKRGAAYAIGGEDLMGKIFKSRCDQRLSPSYEVQAQQALLESFTEEDLKETGLEGLSFRQFLSDEVRPHLALSFATVKSILSKAGIRLSNPDVTHGYNVSVLLPEDCTDESAAQFFAKLRELGVDSPNLSAFTAGSKVEHGFRIPFGGFTTDQCKIFCTLIVQAHRDVFG